MSDVPQTRDDDDAPWPGSEATPNVKFSKLNIGDGLPWALPVAIVWAIVAFSVGFYFAFGIRSEAYGGDAYTGIEGAIVTATKAVGWVIVSSGVLAVLLAGRRYSR